MVSAKQFSLFAGGPRNSSRWWCDFSEVGWRKTRRRTETEEEAEDRGRDSANCDKFEESSPIYPNRDKAFLRRSLGCERELRSLVVRPKSYRNVKKRTKDERGGNFQQTVKNRGASAKQDECTSNCPADPKKEAFEGSRTRPKSTGFPPLQRTDPPRNAIENHFKRICKVHKRKTERNPIWYFIAHLAARSPAMPGPFPPAHPGRGAAAAGSAGAAWRLPPGISAGAAPPRPGATGPGGRVRGTKRGSWNRNASAAPWSTKKEGK